MLSIMYSRYLIIFTRYTLKTHFYELLKKNTISIKKKKIRKILKID